jgi:hypothetical protein
MKKRFDICTVVALLQLILMFGWMQHHFYATRAAGRGWFIAVPACTLATLAPLLCIVRLRHRRLTGTASTLNIAIALLWLILTIIHLLRNYSLAPQYFWYNVMAMGIPALGVIAPSMYNGIVLRRQTRGSEQGNGG